MAERIASRTTDTGETLVLKRRKSDRFGSEYEYFVTEAGSNSRIDRYEPTRQKGMEQLREAVGNYERAAKSKTQRGGGLTFGFGGGGGGQPQMPDFSGGAGGMPMLPGFGMDQSDDDDDDDRGFYIPGL